MSKQKSQTRCIITQQKSHARCIMSQQKKLLVSLVWLIAMVKCAYPVEQVDDESLTTYYWDFRMPGVSTTQPDEYLCNAMKLNSSIEEWLLSFRPEVTIKIAHHMTLFGCADVLQKSGVWDCRHYRVCSHPHRISQWSMNAPGTALPPGVGFRVGGDSNVQYLVLQIHYVTPISDKDRSGYRIQVTKKRQSFMAGILTVSGDRKTLPPNTARIHMEASCLLKTINVIDDIHIIGSRVHTHKLGTVVKGYRYDVKTAEYELIVAGNPQWPQAMYPREEVMTLTPEDVVALQCTYDTTGIQWNTYSGQSNKDEMCLAYLLFYTEHERASECRSCLGVHYPDVIKNLPESSDEQLPPNAVMIAKALALTFDESKVITYQPVVAQAPASRRIEEDSSGEHE